MSQVQTRDRFNQAIKLCHFTVSRSNNPDDPYIEDFFTDYAGNSSWPHQGVPSSNVYLHVNYYNKQLAYEYQRVPVNYNNDVVINLGRSPLPKIQIANTFFFNTGHLKGNTDFLLYQKILGGVNVDDILLQRMNLGSRFVRTIGMVNSFSHYWPQDYGDSYYNVIVPFANRLNSYGLYWYFNVFADTKEIMPDEGQQIAHYNRVVAELSQCNNVFLELVNEQGQHSNSVDRSKFTKPSSIVSSSGSFGTRIAPDPPHWDFIDYHSRRDYPGCVMEVNTADYLDGQGKTRVALGLPIGTGEPVKLGTGDPKAINNARIAGELGFSGYGSSPFNVFHSQNGVMSELFDGDTEGNAKSFFGV